MINPSLLCNKHLIGEHGEIHKHRHVFEKQYSVSGRISPVVQIQPQDMEKRHNELAKEMSIRGSITNPLILSRTYLIYQKRRGTPK
jgi:hypothetical protein